MAIHINVAVRTLHVAAEEFRYHEARLSKAVFGDWVMPNIPLFTYTGTFEYLIQSRDYAAIHFIQALLNFAYKTYD